MALIIKAGVIKMNSKNFFKLNISYSFVLSALFHTALVFVFKNAISEKFSNSTVTFSPAMNKDLSIKLDSIKFVSKEEVMALKQKAHEIPNRQIVANELSGKEQAPANSRFLGEKNQVFDRQTLARVNGAFQEAGLGQKNGAKNSLSQKESQTIKPEKSVAKKGQNKAQTMDMGALAFSGEISGVEKAITDKKNEIKKKAQEESLQALGTAGGKQGLSALAQSSDFVEDVSLGDMTNLNTTEFKYYGFYHRIRSQLEQHWGSSIKDKAKNLYRSGKRMPASENLITSVSVILDEKGSILEMKIEGSSGIRELDQAAIESFNKAGPFPNPPKGLLVGGRATIQWGFVVKS